MANEAGAEGEYMLLGVDLAKDGLYNIYFRPDGQGDDDWYYHSVYVGEVVDETVIYVVFPTENRPANISVAGTFAAGQWGMRIFNEPWSRTEINRQQ